MRQLNVRTLFVCLAALLFVIACADNQQKPAETPEQTVETPSETPAANIEEVTLAVTGMT